VTFGDDKKGKVLGTGVIKVNNFFTSEKPSGQFLGLIVMSH
jgi:hypothetical protein